MGNVGQVLLRQILPGEVIVQVGGPGGVFAPAAKFADVVAEGGGADQGDVHLQPGLLGQLGGMYGHVVHADGMAGRIKGHAVPANAQQGGETVPENCPAKSGVFLGQAAACQLLRTGPMRVQQGVKGAEVPLLGQEPLQKLQIELHGGPLFCGDQGAGWIWEQACGQGFVAETKPPLLRLRAELVQNRSAERQQRAALGPLALELLHPLFKMTGLEQMEESPPVQAQTAGKGVGEAVYQWGQVKAFVHGRSSLVLIPPLCMPEGEKSTNWMTIASPIGLVFQSMDGVDQSNASGAVPDPEGATNVRLP